MSGVEYRLLGPVEVVDGTRAVPIGGAKPRTLLAALLLESGRVISTERLIDLIWAEDPPDSARALIQTYVSGLRRAGGGALAEVIVRRTPGYLTRIPVGSLDRDVFEGLADRARTAAADGRFEAAVPAFRAAEALWRGPALGGVTSRVLAVEAARLDEQRLATMEDRVGVELSLGRGEELVAELSAVVGAHPTRERPRAQLMLALYRAGRTSDALSVYRQGRAALIEELGLEPGLELTRLHEAILRGEADLFPVPVPAPVPARASVAAGPERAVPAQLPPDPSDFTGRTGYVDRMDALLTRTDHGSTVCVVAGPGGVGKSALAVHVGHRVAASYPDGQMYVDLGGTSSTPATVAEVLGRFLRALDPDAATVPEGTDERIDRYRTILAERRVLLVLDDAANEQQVRPLIPGSPSCAVLVTSRNCLPGLSGAYLVELDMLAADEAFELLARIGGEGRIRSAPEAAEEIVARCGRLPLAVRIAGARLATRQRWSPALLAARLADERQRLNEFDIGDQQVRASIELSYRTLAPVAQVVLRRLGRLGLPDFAPWVAAALADVPLAAAERVVEQLVDVHLIDYSFVDGATQVRYRLHDLIRLYAQERAEQDENREDEIAAVTRVLAGWLWLADRLAEARPAGTIDFFRPRGTGTRRAYPEVARAAAGNPRSWLEAEQNALVVSAERAVVIGLDRLAVELSSTLCGDLFAQHNLLDAWARAHTAAVVAARGDVHAEAVLLAQLGHLRLEQDRFVEAREYLSQALAMFRDAADIRGEVAALATLGLACRDQGYLPEARHFLTQASTACTALADDTAVGYCARLTGSVLLEQGDFTAAEEALAAGLAAYLRAGSDRGVGLTRRTLAMLHRARGDLALAERECLGALAIFEQLDDPLLAAYCGRTLAKTRLRMGVLDGVRPALESALRTARAGADRWGEGLALRTLGELHLAAGRLDEAARSLDAALAVWDVLALPLWRARTLRDVADVCAARGEPGAARRVRADALAIFQAHGAREYTELTTAPIEKSQNFSTPAPQTLPGT
jgi:DNA-binding SARP family transcriptional activator/tetratricopeptide (TPR) repeat protein